MSHHALLAQMQMLSFYQFYGQQKKFVAEAENRERMVSAKDPLIFYSSRIWSRLLEADIL